MIRCRNVLQTFWKMAPLMNKVADLFYLFIFTKLLFLMQIQHLAVETGLVKRKTGNRTVECCCYEWAWCVLLEHGCAFPPMWSRAHACFDAQSNSILSPSEKVS